MATTVEITGTVRTENEAAGGGVGVGVGAEAGVDMGEVEGVGSAASSKASLRDRLAEVERSGGDKDAILTQFLEYVEEIGLELYPAQEEAILELIDHKHVVLNTPTGSGKSLVAMALHFQALVEGRISVYTCPIKALVNEKFFDLCDLFGPENVGLLTGDASVNRDAPIICCTAEILANMALRDPDLAVDYVVMDEFHFYGDRERGVAWQIPLISTRDTLFLMMSATLGDMEEIVQRLEKQTDRDVAVVTGSERPVPLEFRYTESLLHETIQELLAADEAPIYLVNFTQRSCAEQAQGLTCINITTKEEKKAIARHLEGFRFDSPYGKELQRFLRAGIGVHHAGLLPKYRLLVEKLSQAGLLKVISGTDSLGVGVNVPIRTVLFSEMNKFDGEKTGLVTIRQFHQIAGRAGRRGYDDHGLVVVQAPEHVVENRRIAAKIQANPNLKRKLVRRQPPKRGYVVWDEAIFNRYLSSPPEPLEPRFQVNHGMLVQVLRGGVHCRDGGYGRLLALINGSHLSEVDQKKQRRLAAQLFRSLRGVGVVEVLADPDAAAGSMVQLSGNLQQEFSLNQVLSLYLVETLKWLEPELESYALDIVSLVEAVQEHPTIILMRQVDKLKGELVARLKSEGVEYEERMAELEKVDYPKPNAEFIYDTFNRFAERHPWVGNDNIRPKSIVRDLYEQALGFNDYIKEYGLARSEGVLLRYLSQVYKALVQSVPEVYRTEELDDLMAFLHTIIRRTDSSLLDEWERMMDGELVLPRQRKEEAGEVPRTQALAVMDERAVFKRARTELHLLMRALADRRYEDACELVHQTEDHPWSPDAFKDAMDAYRADHGPLDVTPQARRSEYTLIGQMGPRCWEVQQKLLDVDGQDDGVLVGVVDLREPREEEEPLVELVRIGV